MTYIEFFDKNLIENICSALAHAPDRIILIGDSRKLLAAHAKRYHDILAERGNEVEVIPRSVNKNNMSDVIKLLSEIVESYDDCVFDLTGGEDTCLVATGIVFERYKEKNIQMHWINISTSHIQDCDLDGQTISLEPHPEITVEENIRIYGGDIVYTDSKPVATYKWSMDAEFEHDIEAMWRVCKSDVRAWNSQIGVFLTACNKQADGGLSVSVPLDDLLSDLGQSKSKLSIRREVVSELIKAGLIHGYSDDGKTFSVTFKNEQIKRCLTKAGLALELKMFVAAENCETKSGEKVYNDVMNGVFIDWDGDVHVDRSGTDTENEVDLILMHGMIPVFVSCKNGYIDIDELYKLNIIANRFGGSYAKRILVATALPKDGDFAENFRSRAADMGIRVIDDVTEITDSELSRQVSSFWLN